MQVTGTRQHEAWQQREFPPVEQVASGIWSVPVPIPASPLRYVLSYLIEHPSGFLMVDTGWDDPESWQVLRDGLATAGIPITSITGIVITHVHPDHHGLSAAVREASGAWIGMHEAEAAFLANQMNSPRSGDRLAEFLHWAGAPDEHLASMGGRRGRNRMRPMATPDRLIPHGELLDVPGLDIRAVWTPGHSPGHLCFHDEARDLLLTGDHVLPRITPNISSWDEKTAALEEYLTSLERLRGIEPREVLPAHEYRFTGLDSRLDYLAEHHEERLAEIAARLRTRPGQSSWEVAAHVSWSRPWDQLSGIPRQSAIGEVIAHLCHLQQRGQATCTLVDGTGLWRLTGDTPVTAGPLAGEAAAAL